MGNEFHRLYTLAEMLLSGAEIHVFPRWPLPDVWFGVTTQVMSLSVPSATSAFR